MFRITRPQSNAIDPGLQVGRHPSEIRGEFPGQDAG